MTSPDSPIPEVRRVTDVATLKVLSDPLRLAILRVLRQGGTRQQPQVWSVKELAAELGEPQTKLYRHIKQLVDHDLVQVAETRLVSGIVEQRYRSGQFSLHIDDAILGQETGQGHVQRVFDAAFEGFRREYATALRQGRIPHDSAASEKYRDSGLFTTEVRLTPERAGEFRERLTALLEEYGRTDDPDGTVPVRILNVYYSPDPRG